MRDLFKVKTAETRRHIWLDSLQDEYVDQTSQPQARVQDTRVWHFSEPKKPSKSWSGCEVLANLQGDTGKAVVVVVLGGCTWMLGRNPTVGLEI